MRAQQSRSGGTKRTLGALGAAACVALAPAAWRWVTQDARDWEPNEAAPGSQSPSLTVKGVRLFEARQPDGSRAWEFAVQKIELSPDKRFATLSDVSRATLFREGKPYLQMSAAQVRFDQQTRDWQAHEKLKVVGPDGLSIGSEQARWDEKAQRLDCPGAVTARFKGADIKTVGLRYDAQGSKLESLQPVHVTAPSVEATGERVEADVKNRIVTFPQGVEKLVVKKPLLEKYGLRR